MPRSAARLTDGARLADYIGLGVIAKTFPRERVLACLEASGAQTRRHRDLPNDVVVYYVIAMALYMNVSCKEVLRLLLEAIRWLSDGSVRIAVTGKSGISQARTRVGAEPLARLHDAVVGPIATGRTPGAWYRRWRLLALDGTTMEVPDTATNAAAFGRPRNGHAQGAYPRLRLVSLVEATTHVLFATRLSPYTTGELTLAREVVAAVRPDMLVLADRLFYATDLWNRAQATGAALLWRVPSRARLPCERRLDDGSYLSRLHASEKDRRRLGRGGWAVRVIEYTLEGPTEAPERYRLMTNLLDPLEAPAEELAALYARRWEIETAFDELKTHLRGSRVVLRSKQPELVRQEVYGLLLAHFAIRGLMHEAALKAQAEPDRLSFVHAVRVVRRKLPGSGAVPPSGQAGV